LSLTGTTVNIAGRSIFIIDNKAIGGDGGRALAGSTNGAGGAGQGGGLYEAAKTTATLTRGSISSNTATAGLAGSGPGAKAADGSSQGGGAFVDPTSLLDDTNGTVVGNTATEGPNVFRKK
jgi:hypothetical protein